MSGYKHNFGRNNNKGGSYRNSRIELAIERMVEFEPHNKKLERRNRSRVKCLILVKSNRAAVRTKEWKKEV